MASQMLTAHNVSAMKPGPRLRTVRDSLTGVELRIRPDGEKTWSFRYRALGKQRRWKVGNYPTVSLAVARKRANNLKLQVSNGIDPQAEKRKARLQAEAEAQRLTLRGLVELYITDYAMKRKRTWKTDRRILHTYVLPQWKHLQAADVTRRHVRELLDAIASGRHEVHTSSNRSARSKAARPAPVMANRVLEVVRTMFNFALDREHIEVNPASRIAKPGDERTRDRVLSDDEVRQMWKACDKLAAPMAALFKLRLILAQRGGETATMRWCDVDLDGGWWTIPAERSKNGLAHRVPLTEPALEILRALHKDRAKGAKPADYVLVGARGRAQRRLAAREFQLANFIGHDLRRTAATRMGSAGVSRFVIARVLNHVDGGVTSVYDRATYDNEKRAALETWAAALVRITSMSD